ncbi:Sodium:solute symporter family-domain-containing protein [Achaetomium macrosporum]|uniref:Sodium:solute symporter family-domain-containing protein n=1 Tax=Achaetomium macrosporum TaxID=79813 RepID=A0AAN7HBS9_9PEZI|nr:Sodium:solute symporter family-domain-containing protein [Achaetomium macrosporum]
MESAVQPPLPQGAGYGVIIGLGLTFALGIVWVTRGMKNALHKDNQSTETFMVANRSIGTGLIAAAVISSWLYSIALLGSALLTYRYGVALAVWWGASASTMVTFFSFIAIQVKRRAPNAHTLLELIRVRYGKTTHVLWIVLCLVNNFFVFSNMLLSASTTVSALIGMNVIASTFLMPVGVAAYTYLGGLRATFLTDPIHTFIIMIILAWFTIRVITVPEIGSISALYDAILAADQRSPVDGNYRGSHLTMRSTQSVMFGVLHIISNFGTITMDTGFWQKGGVASFAPPFAIGTIVGLAAIALESTPSFPTYPRMMASEEVNAGLVLPFVAQAVAGRSGAAAILVVTFMVSSQAQAISMHILDIVVEIGPHSALQGPLRQLSKTMDPSVKFPAYFSAIARGSDNVKDVLTMAGNLFTRGYEVDLGRVNAVEQRGGNQYQLGKVITDLPHYQWQYSGDIVLFENRYTRDSFAQSVCIIGYTLFPIVIAALLSALHLPQIPRIPVYLFLVAWSMAAGVSILGGSGVVKNRVGLAV